LGWTGGRTERCLSEFWGRDKEGRDGEGVGGNRVKHGATRVFPMLTITPKNLCPPKTHTPTQRKLPRARACTLAEQPPTKS